MTELTSTTRQGRNIAFFLIAVALLFLFRSLWTYPIEHGDAIQKYFFSSEILRSGHWGILLHNHHTLRWAAMLPEIGLNWLLGSRYEIFYILPLLMFSLYVVLIVFSLKEILNFSQQLLLVSILLTEPNSLPISNQFLIPGLGIFFSFAGILLLVKQWKHPHLAVALAAICFFIAYGAHVTYLSFAAGGFFWLLLYPDKRPRLTIFCAGMLLLLLIETLVFNYLSDWHLTFGRIEALASSPHVERAVNYAPVASSKLLTRWLLLSPPQLLLCLFFLISGPWLVLQKRTGRPVPVFIECTYLVGLCFALATTFAVYSIVPLRPVMPLRVKYLIPFLPFAAILTVYMLSIFIARFLPQTQPRTERVASLVVAVTLLVLPTLSIDFYASKFKAFMWHSNRQYSQFAEMFRDGELSLTGKRKIVYSMIARFKYPLTIQRRESSLSVRVLAPGFMCVPRLDKSPLQLNYEVCPINSSKKAPDGKDH